jgi:hypothetical protein
MIYPLLKPAQQLTSKIQQWARIHRDRLGILAEFRPHGEVRLIASTQPLLVSSDYISGCTLSIRDDALIIACSEACAEIEKAVAKFLHKAKLIGKGQPISLIEEFKRKNIRHAHEMGRPVSDAAKAKRKERRDESLSDRPPARFDTVLDAALAAAEAAGPWLILHERAIKTARESHYLDPDYVYQALVDLAHAARYSSEHKGLGMPWADFLGQRGSHDFVPNTSSYTIERYFGDYHINYRGEMRCIQAHIRQGNGSADECLRIYVVQPRAFGDPIVIGQIGAHLPTAERSH